MQRQIDLERESFEHIVHQHGDDLYRLAVLLTSDLSSAYALMQRVARSFRNRNPAGVLDVTHALFEHTHRHRSPLRRNALPGWTTMPGVRTEDAPLLAAIARLPDAQRLALGMAVLHSFDAEDRASHTIAGREWRALVRDALLALLPVVDSAIDESLFDLDLAPEECRVTRAALTLDPTAASDSSEVRGHLALCAACRHAARDWRRAVLRVEETLRDALRPFRPPEDVVAQAINAARPDTRPPIRRIIESHWSRRALLPLAVLFLMALIIWPRGNIEDSTVPAPAGYSLRELIARAEQTLYLPPPGDGGWQGGYLMRWTFVDQTYANLRGNLWIDRETGQHRIQLVHQQGGGPYEFQLVDSRLQAWYAVAPSYSATLGFPFEGEEALGVQASVDTNLRQRLLAARLESGAWAIPSLYLAQARTAEVQSWGRRQLDDGTQVEVIGFRGVSLLGFPPDAPEAGDSGATILLAIDSATGSLREIRELVGPSEGEQVSRTVWAFDGGREMDPREEVRIFGIAFAWNGRGTFVRQETIGTPRIPLIPAEAIVPLERANREGMILPEPAPDMVEVILASEGQISGSDTPFTLEWYSVIYSTPGRWLTIRTLPPSGVRVEEFAGPDTEQTSAGPYAVWLRPDARWGYRATVSDGSASGWGYIAQVEARGYTRAELLRLLASLDRVTPERLARYRALNL